MIKDTFNAYLRPTGTCVDDLRICRAYLCYNIVINDDKTRECLCKLFNKMPANINYLHQKKAYTGGRITYSMGIYRGNKSRNFQIYDKNRERKEKSEIIMPYEKNVLREELQILYYAIKYHAKHEHVPATFDYWINLKTEKQYLEAARKFFPTADFWSLKRATEIINNSAYKPTMKAKLIEYINNVANAEALDRINPKLGSSQTISGYIKRLSDINVNPVTIDKKWGIDYIKNPMY